MSGYVFCWGRTYALLRGHYYDMILFCNIDMDIYGHFPSDPILLAICTLQISALIDATLFWTFPKRTIIGYFSYSALRNVLERVSVGVLFDFDHQMWVYSLLKVQISTKFSLVLQPEYRRFRFLCSKSSKSNCLVIVHKCKMLLTS